jgi:hypothetical protein
MNKISLGTKEDLKKNILMLEEQLLEMRDIYHKFPDDYELISYKSPEGKIKMEFVSL